MTIGKPDRASAGDGPTAAVRPLLDSVARHPASSREETHQRLRVKRFFLKGKGRHEGMVRVRAELRQMVTFKQLNLLSDSWPISGPFDAIFCRNVMIYFDKPTQGKILNRFAPLMKSDALLFAGHSENFLYVSNMFKLRGKTVYELDAKGATNGAALRRFEK